MGYISSINHANFARLHEITNNYNKATLLDKLIFWWQISTYTLDDDKIWFTRSLDQIALDSKISKRSVERYLHDFEAGGYIEKTNRLFKKKNLYIRITDKLLLLLASQENLVRQKEPATFDDNTLNLNQIGDTDSANLAISIYKDQDNNKKTNNTVTQTSNVYNSLNLTTPFKNYLKGTLRNLQAQHGLLFSNPEQLLSEITFSILNTNQFSGIEDQYHRVNIIAKLLRQKKWRTPRGFHQHWQLTDKTGYSQIVAPKRSDTAKIHNQKMQLQPLKLEHHELTLLINTENRYLNEMKLRLIQKPDQLTEQIVKNTVNKLSKLKTRAEETTHLIKKIEQGYCDQAAS